MRQQTGQATVEWLMIGLMVTSILWLAEQQWDLVQQLRDWGTGVIAHYYFVFNYLSLAPGSGL